MMSFEATQSYARKLDSQDELAPFRDLFRIPAGPHNGHRIYFCGNSLGLQPGSLKENLDGVLKTWAEKGVGGFTDPEASWMGIHDEQLDVISDLTGAQKNELVLMNTLSVNLHLMMVSFYRPHGRRNKVIMEKGAFPSDRYAVCSQIRQRGLDPGEVLIEIEPDGNGILDEEEICTRIAQTGDELALVLFSGVGYYSGQVLNMSRIASASHETGAMVGFDLAHGTGNIPLSLHDWGVDFAVWCHYKYLNAGPGAVGGAFIHRKHHHHVADRFEGWWGTDLKKRFLMTPEFHPAAGASAWQISTAQILPLAALSASLDIFRKARFNRLRNKSEKLTAYLSFLLKNIDSIKVITPEDAGSRGAQLSLRAGAKGKELFEKLSENGVVADWRNPDVIRVAPVPLYNTFEEVFAFYDMVDKFVAI